MGVYAMLSYLCYCNSDGRVSDGTKELIRRLIVLEPELRLTASQVLDALSTIIASNRLLCHGVPYLIPYLNIFLCFLASNG